MIVFVLFIFFYYRKYGILVHETYGVVDMTVGVVANDPFIDPEYLFYAIVINKVFFNLLLIKVRVSVLVKQARSGCEQGAFAIEFNRTTFHYDSGVKYRKIQMICDQRWNNIIQVEGRVFAAPGIITPIDNRFGYTCIF